MAMIKRGEPCFCGNTDPVQYRLYESKSSGFIGKRCNVCHREWLTREFQPSSEDTTDAPHLNAEYLFQRTPMQLEENTAFQILGSKTKLDWKFDILKPGDHIAWNRKLGHWHHAILDEINEYGIVVIHWTKTSNGRIQITQEWQPHVEEDQDALYRLDYPEEITTANSKELVLARARSRIGDSKYGLLDDNCESFATFCKTGSEKSHQVVWLKAKMKEFLEEFGVTTVKTLMKSGCKIATSMTEKALQDIVKSVASSVSSAAEKASQRIAEKAIQEFAKHLGSVKAVGKITEETIKQTWNSVVSKAVSSADKAAVEITEEAVFELTQKFAGKVAFAETIEKVKSASNWVGAGIVILLEGAFAIRDLNRTYSERKNGTLSRRVYIEETTRRSVEGVSAATLTILFSLGPEAIGFLIGSPLGPLGTFFGGIVGGAIGCALGRALGTTAGSHMGRAIACRFQDDRAVKSIGDLQPGDHVVLSCGGCLHPRCHAIVVKHNGVDHINVIRNTYKKGVVEEWIKFTQPLYRVEYASEGACRDPEKVILYARLKGFEDYRYSLAEYNCKTFARECKTKSVLL